jgi:hypothetical protein
MQQLVPDEAHDRIEIQPIRFSDPLHWLWMGLRDMASQSLISLFYGVCFWLMALILLAVFKTPCRLCRVACWWARFWRWVCMT